MPSHNFFGRFLDGIFRQNWKHILSVILDMQYRYTIYTTKSSNINATWYGLGAKGVAYRHRYYILRTRDCVLTSLTLINTANLRCTSIYGLLIVIVNVFRKTGHLLAILLTRKI